MKLTEDDIYIYEWEDSEDPNKTELCILVKDSKTAKELKQQILENQEIVERLRDG